MEKLSLSQRIYVLAGATVLSACASSQPFLGENEDAKPSAPSATQKKVQKTALEQLDAQDVGEQPDGTVVACVVKSGLDAVDEAEARLMAETDIVAGRCLLRDGEYSGRVVGLRSLSAGTDDGHICVRFTAPRDVTCQ